MSDYILGSHNSWSYETPLKWYMRPFHFIAKCQSKDTLRQYYDYGVRLFDLRVKLVNDSWYLAHGSMVFNVKAIDALEDLNTFVDSDDIGKTYVRVILEYNKEPDDEIVNKFTYLCDYIKEQFGDAFTFFGGLVKATWKTVYDFGTEAPTLDDKYSSQTTLFNVSENSKLYSILKVIDDWCPWIYAKLNNKKNYENGTEKDCLLMDFVNIGYSE